MSHRLTTIGLAAFLTAVSLGAADARDELCLRSSLRVIADCRLTTGASAVLEPASVDREIVWRRGEKTELAIGTLFAGIGTVDLDQKEWRSVSVSLRGADPDLWPQPVRIALRLGTRAPIIAELTAVETQSLRTIRVPAQPIEIEISAPHHRSIRIDLASPARRVLGSMTLVPYPVVSGSALDRNHRPVVAANVSLPSGERIAATDTAGRFRVELREAWPQLIRITVPGHASAIVSLPKAEASVDIGEVIIRDASTLTIHITGGKPNEAELFRRDRRDLSSVASEPSPDPDIVFADVPEGSYLLMLRGAGPLEQLGVPFSIRAGEPRKLEVSITPLPFTLRVKKGGVSLPGAAVTLGPAGGEWRGTVATDTSGASATTLWQRGEFVAFVRADGRQDSFVAHDELRGDDAVAWEINLPAHVVSGHILDQDGHPIVGAHVYLRSDSSDGSTVLNGKAGDDGGFEFGSVLPGKQSLSAAADGFYDTPPVNFVLDDSEDTAYKADITLDRAQMRTIIVTGASGQPVADAALLDEHGETSPLLVTDASGTAKIALRQGETRTLYVLPRDGSFAIVDAAASKDAQAEPIRVSVPAGTATLFVRARTADGDPIGGAQLVLRVGGRFLPSDVRVWMFNRMGFPLASDADGNAVFYHLPTGQYELWPYFTAAQEHAIESGQSDPPVRIAAAPGDNTVVLTFKAVPHRP